MNIEIDNSEPSEGKKLNTNKFTETRGGYRENSGRPLRDEKGKSVTVSFCLTPTENKLFREKLKESTLSVSEYIRSKLFN